MSIESLRSYGSVTTASAASLKLCSCGAQAALCSNGRYWFAACSQCDRATIHMRTREEAEQAWNTEFPA